MASSKNHIEPETKLVEFEKKLDALKKENENLRELVKLKDRQIEE